MEPLFTSNSTLTADDYIAFTGNATARRRRVMQFIFIFGMLFGACSLILIYNHTGEISGMCIIGMLLFVLGFVNQSRWKDRARKSFQKYKLIHDNEMTFNFFDDHFIIISENDTSTIPYSKLYKIKITPTHVFFYTGEGFAIILNTEDQELKEFLTTVKQKYNL